MSDRNREGHVTVNSEIMFKGSRDPFFSLNWVFFKLRDSFCANGHVTIFNT